DQGPTGKGCRRRSASTRTSGKSRSGCNAVHAPLKQKQIEQSKLEAEARKEATVQNAEASAQATVKNAEAQAQAKVIQQSGDGAPQDACRSRGRSNPCDRGRRYRAHEE